MENLRRGEETGNPWLHTDMSQASDVSQLSEDKCDDSAK